MDIDQRIKAFARLGNYLRNMSPDEMQTLTGNARNENSWFTKESVELALKSVEEFLTESSLRKWLTGYSFSEEKKTVALVLAGNIPLVGFHDLLCVLISGNAALLKLSSKDNLLMKFIIEKLTEVEPQFGERIVIADRLRNFDAVIATGSDNTSRYFEYYFAKYPHIIRRNRTSVAILDGTESEQEFRALGRDVFSYFGLGCRNVSKLFVPVNYSFNKLFESWEVYKEIANHHKYCNNYDYQKSILLVNRQEFLDNGFVIIQQSERMVSPISVLYFDYYKDDEDLQQKISEDRDKIQVIVGKSHLSGVEFGQAQAPRLDDYADNIDTLKFMGALK